MAIGTPDTIGANFVANSTANQSFTVDTAVAVGDTVIIVVANDGGGIPTGVTDSKGNTYVADHAGQHDADDFSVRQFSSRLTTALAIGDTVTAAHGTSGTWDRHIVGTKISGLLTTTGWVDKTAVAVGTTGLAYDSGSTAATAIANELVFGYVVVGGAVAATEGFTPGTSLTKLYEHANSGFIDVGVFCRVVSATGAYKINASTVSPSTSDRWAAGAITYKEQAAADTTPPTTNVTSGTTRISDETGKDSYAWSFQANEACQAWKVKVVADAGDPHTSGAQVESGGAISANTTVSGSLTYAELNAAGQGAEGAKILKFFAQDSAGNWST